MKPRNKEEKIAKIFTIPKKDWELFAMTAKMLNLNMSEIISEYVRDFNIIHKAELHERIIKL